jgi:hypothetical protein
VGVAVLEAVPVAKAAVVVTVGRLGGEGRGGPEVLRVMVAGSEGWRFIAVAGRLVCCGVVAARGGEMGVREVVV